MAFIHAGGTIIRKELKIIESWSTQAASLVLLQESTTISKGPEALNQWSLVVKDSFWPPSLELGPYGFKISFFKTRRQNYSQCPKCWG